MFELFLSKSFTALWAGSSGTLTLTAHTESKMIVTMRQAALGTLLLRLHVGCISAARLWRTLLLATFFTCGCCDHLFIITFLGTVKSVNVLFTNDSDNSTLFIARTLASAARCSDRQVLLSVSTPASMTCKFESFASLSLP